jgi:hypothetical protein
LRDLKRDLSELNKSKPKVRTVKPASSQLDLFNTVRLKDGNEYNKSDINSDMLESMGYSPKRLRLY